MVSSVLLGGPERFRHVVADAAPGEAHADQRGAHNGLLQGDVLERRHVSG
jgi:hypothetical protein